MEESGGNFERGVRPELAAAQEMGREILEGFNKIMSDLHALEEMLGTDQITEDEYDEILKVLLDELREYDAYFRFFRTFFEEHQDLRTTARRHKYDRQKQEAQIRKLLTDTHIPASIHGVIIAYELDEDATPALKAYIDERTAASPTALSDEWIDAAKKAEERYRALAESIRLCARDKDPLRDIPGLKNNLQELADALSEYVAPCLDEIIRVDPACMDAAKQKTLPPDLINLAARSTSAASAHYEKRTDWLPPHPRGK